MLLQMVGKKKGREMKTIVHKSETRGHFDFGWLDTRHTFSFARYYDPERVNFGALRVLNDDIVKPGEGFGRHPHDNMEIISIPISGKLLHRDSMGHEQVIKTGEVQVMSAGTGIFHEEYNASKNDPTNFLQIWIIPKKRNVKPQYSQTYFNPEDAVNRWQRLVTNNDPDTLNIHQDAIISRVFLTEGESINYQTREDSFGSYVFLINGSIGIKNTLLDERDGLGISDVESFGIRALKDSYILNIEVPDINSK